MKQLINDIESQFNMEHACSCTEQCDCWKKFKERHEVNKDREFIIELSRYIPGKCVNFEACAFCLAKLSHMIEVHLNDTV